MAVSKRGNQSPRGVEGLKEKLKAEGITNLRVFPGGKWKDLTPDQRADAVLDILQSVERGWVSCDFKALAEMAAAAE
jgi:hypothetical protein